jgi:uncharacterized protein involved in exopolysaccharide biosynthesis
VTNNLDKMSRVVAAVALKRNEAESRVRQVEDVRKAGRDLKELSFIANQGGITRLVDYLAKRRSELADLSKQLSAQDPTVIQATNDIKQAEKELNVAVETAVISVTSDFENERANQTAIESQLERFKAEAILLDRSAPEYTQLTRNLLTNQLLLSQMQAKLRQVRIGPTILSGSQIRLIDKAVPPPEGESYLPRFPE